MRQTRALGLRHISFATIAVLFLLRPPTSAQDVTEPSLKAAYIYNFAKFTEWPPPVPSAKSFVMCVLGDAAVGNALERTVEGRQLAGNAITVSRLTRPASQQACQVLYVSGITADQASQLVAALRDAPVLTISDMERFTEVGGVAQFFFEHGRLRFSVDLESAKRAGLKLSSKLLTLALRK